MMVTKRWIVEGRVQGVSFRAYAQRKAVELGLRGWVRNLSNGRVETLAQGDDERLTQYHMWLERGPSRAAVKNLIMTVEESIEKYEDFVIQHE